MTTSEETTAALIARLHRELEGERATGKKWREIAEKNAQNAASAMTQLDEQRTRADIAEMARDVHQACVVEVDRLVGDARRERDEWRARAEKAESALEVHQARCEGFERELAAARRERDNLILANDQNYMVGKEERLKRHAADARVAQLSNERDEARAVLAKLEWAATWMPSTYCLPKCPVCDNVMPCDEARRLLAPSVIGHKPECWFAKKVTIPAGTLMVKNKDGAVSPAAGATVFKVTREYVLPMRDGVDTVTVRVSEPASQDPKFKVGQKVLYGDRRGTVHDWSPTMEGAFVRFDDGGALWVHGHELKPAPKFAVGEWVIHSIHGDAEIARREWESRPVEKPRGSWVYSMVNRPGIRVWEESLIAQTPQHKHDCAGCVFLGRMGTADLYWLHWHDGEPATKVITNAGMSMAEACAGGGSAEHIEARRRAVARGLV